MVVSSTLLTFKPYDMSNRLGEANDGLVCFRVMEWQDVHLLVDPRIVFFSVVVMLPW
jgi:hypothetical protein